MAESAIKFLLDKLTLLFENDFQLLRGLREEIVYLRGELEHMTAFLRIAYAFEESDEEVKVWVKQVRDIAHDSEDALDEFTILQAHDHGKKEQGFLYSSIRRLSCCIKKTKARYHITSQLQGINLRIRKISNVHETLSHKFCTGEVVGKRWETHGAGVRDALLLERSGIVGIDEPIKKMVGWLVKGSFGCEVVSMAGMEGMGKTTLAKQVYDVAQVKKHFKVCAWITVLSLSNLEKSSST